MRWLFGAAVVIAACGVTLDAELPPRHVPAFSLEQITQVRTYGQWAIAPDGTRVAYAVSGFYFGFPVVPRFGEDNNIRVVSVDTGEIVQVTTGPIAKTSPVFSPRGDRLAFESEGDIWSAELASGAVKRLTFNAAADRSPTWSPDGKQIAFVSNRSGHTAIWVMPSSGERDGVRALTTGTENEDEPQWSPDARSVAFTAKRSDEHYYASGIYVVDVSGGAATRLTAKDTTDNFTPRWSRDGRRLAFLSDRSGFVHVWVMNADGSGARDYDTGPRETMSPHWQVAPMWSPDGTRILVSANRQGSFDLVTISVDEGRVDTIATGPGKYHEVGWGRDKALLYAYENAWSPPALYVKASPTGAPRRLTQSSYASFRPDAFAEAKRVTAAARDGLTLSGFLVMPSVRQPGERFPAIVVLHPNSYGQFYDDWNPFFHYLAQSGYVLLLLDQRGSSGYGRGFRNAAVGAWGTKTFDDVLVGAEFVKSQPFVDASRVGVMGLSFGGYQSLLAATKTPGTFRAVVDLMGPTDRRPPFSNRNSVFHIGATPQENPALYDRVSPLTSVKDLRDPLLIIHSDQDRNVAPAQTSVLVDELQRQGKPYELRIYRDEAHGLADPAHQLDSYRLILGFFDRHLKGH